MKAKILSVPFSFHTISFTSLHSSQCLVQSRHYINVRHGVVKLIICQQVWHTHLTISFYIYLIVLDLYQAQTCNDYALDGNIELWLEYTLCNQITWIQVSALVLVLYDLGQVNLIFLYLSFLKYTVGIKVKLTLQSCNEE